MHTPTEVIISVVLKVPKYLLTFMGETKIELLTMDVIASCSVVVFCVTKTGALYKLVGLIKNPLP